MIIEPPTPARPLAVRSTLLRSVLLVLLDEAKGQPVTVAELCAGMAEHGFTVRGRPSKVVSDALRVELGKGRAVRLGRGRYALGSLPRTTRWRCRERVRAVARGRVAPIHLARPTRARTPEVIRDSLLENLARADERIERTRVARRRNAGGGWGWARGPLAAGAADRAPDTARVAWGPAP